MMHLLVIDMKRKKAEKTKINRVFRDKEELPLSSNLSDSIDVALADSEFLIVICTPRLASFQAYTISEQNDKIEKQLSVIEKQYKENIKSQAKILDNEAIEKVLKGALGSAISDSRVLIVDTFGNAGIWKIDEYTKNYERECEYTFQDEMLADSDASVIVKDEYIIYVDVDSVKALSLKDYKVLWEYKAYDENVDFIRYLMRQNVW